MKLLADENFPLTAYQLFKDNGFDIEHIRFIKPSSPDSNVLDYAIETKRVVLTFDSDYGTLVFQKGYKPLAVIYFRLFNFHPSDPYTLYLETIEKGYVIENEFTVIEQDNIRQRPIV